MRSSIFQAATCVKDYMLSKHAVGDWICFPNYCRHIQEEDDKL